jgi:plasmid stabilization system protein ParE
MTEPIITDRAHADLDEMWDHIAQRDPAGADRLIDRFYASAGIASRFLSN